MLDFERRLTKELSFGKVLDILYRQRMYYIAKKLEKFNINKAEYRLLIQVYIEEGCCQEQLVNYLGIDKFEASKVIKSLIEKKYLMKKKDEIDKRKHLLYLTDSAKDIKEEFIGILTDSVDILVKGVSEEEKRITMKVLVQMTENAYTESQKLRKIDK
ncbi:MAG: MarR family winged helix-turn-helix transcriptional regulator [Sarcina sp.]